MTVTSASASWTELDATWRRCLELAWASAVEGNLGVGSVVTDDGGTIVATGRNRLMGTDAGDDLLAGTPIAHGEMNALAKLRWGGGQGSRAGWTLWMSLEPCLMCAGSIRLAGIPTVRYLAPDGIWAGQWRIPEVCPYADNELGTRWPAVEPAEPNPFVAFAALLPMHVTAIWLDPTDMPPPWIEWSSGTVALACDLAASHELVELARASATAEATVAQLWDRLVTAAETIVPA